MSKDEQVIIPEEYLGRDVGQLAEDVLRTWISEKTELTINFAHKDKEGWDCILEFPSLTPEEGQPWDTAPPRTQCWVQVKGTDSHAKKRNVKLSNWHKLIDTQLPAFFLICEYDPEGLRGAYLVHVHGTWMERVLRRLRETRQGQSPPLREQYVTLTWSEEHRLNPANGIGLIGAILKHIGDDVDAYVQNKQRMRRELGLDAPFLIHVTGRPYANHDEMYRELVDAVIGLRELPVSNLTLEKNVRFGSPAETLVEGEGAITISPEGTEVTLTLRNTAGSKRAVFPGTFYSADYFFRGHELPGEYKKYRLQFPLGQIIFVTQGKTSSQTMLSVEMALRFEPPTGTIPLDELANSYRVVTLLQNASGDGLHMEVVRQGAPPVQVSSTETPSLPKELGAVARMVENAWYLTRHLDLPLETGVTVKEIVAQQEALTVARTMLDVNQPVIHAVKGPFTGTSDALDREHAIVIGRVIGLGPYRICIAAGLAGAISLSEDGTEFELIRPTRAHTEHFFLQNGSDLREPLTVMYERLRKKGYEVLEYEDDLHEAED